MTENVERVKGPKAPRARAGARASKGAPRAAAAPANVKETRRSAADTRADAGVERKNALSEEIMKGRAAPPDTSKVPVKLLKQYSPYNAGEVAGFPPAEADRLIATGYAEAHLPEDTERAEEELRKLREDGDAQREARTEAQRSAREEKRGRQARLEAAQGRDRNTVGAQPARGRASKKKGGRKKK